MQVELRYAGVPHIGALVVHYWFVTNELERRDRWEIWQSANAGETSVGHLHRNLMHPDSDVGGTPTQLEFCWTGEAAQCLIGTLHRSWESYPFRHRYRAVPGPNSNTFVAWVLREAGIAHRLSWKGIGKNYIKHI